MTKPDALVRLEQAISDERIEVQRQKERYEALTAQMMAFQKGDGPAPTTEDFEQWRGAAEAQVSLRRLQAGV